MDGTRGALLTPADAAAADAVVLDITRALLLDAVLTTPPPPSSSSSAATDPKEGAAAAKAKVTHAAGDALLQLGSGDVVIDRRQFHRLLFASLIRQPHRSLKALERLQARRLDNIGGGGAAC
jgi:hypothetical protein